MGPRRIFLATAEAVMEAAAEGASAARAPEGDLVLVELIAPMATKENKQRESLIAALLSGPFQDTKFKTLHRAEDGTPRIVEVRS